MTRTELTTRQPDDPNEVDDQDAPYDPGDPTTHTGLTTL